MLFTAIKSKIFKHKISGLTWFHLSMIILVMIIGFE